jgi:hypothetical protein
LSIDEVIKSLLDHDEMMKTFIYVVSTGSITIFKLLVELLEPESFKMPETDSNYSMNLRKKGVSKIEFSFDYSLLNYVWASGCIPIYKYLIENSDLDLFSNDNPTKETPLHWAVCNEQEAMISLLIQEYTVDDEDLNVRDINGHSPLFVAAVKGYRKIFDTLLKAGSYM